MRIAGQVSAFHTESTPPPALQGLGTATLEAQRRDAQPNGAMDDTAPAPAARAAYMPAPDVQSTSATAIALVARSPAWHAEWQHDGGPPARPAPNPFDEMLASSPGINATPGQRAIVAGALARIRADARGKVVLQAMQAYYELLGGKPLIRLHHQEAYGRVPSLARDPVRDTQWHLDSAQLPETPTEDLVNQLCTLYNNMTGLLDGEGPFAAMLANGQPALDPVLELDWTTFIDAGEPAHGCEGERRPTASSRRRAEAIGHLRAQLQALRCYGGVHRETLVAVLVDQCWDDITSMAVNLSGLGLNRIPPLPDDIAALRISDNPITDWSNLPPRLKALDASNTGATGLFPYVPATLVELDVSENSLAELPETLPALKRLRAWNNTLRHLPALPDSLEVLEVESNALTRLPDDLPPTLKELSVASNCLEGLPRLPNGLEYLDISSNGLTSLHIERWPDALHDLNLSFNPGLTLPTPLPSGLRKLNLTATRLESLPHDLPRSLEELWAASNMLRNLPEGLPRSLYTLEIADNRISVLPADIAELVQCEINLECNPISVEDVHIGDWQAGPYFHFSQTDDDAYAWTDDDLHDAHASRTNTLAEAVRAWLPDSPDGDAIVDRIVAMASNDEGDAFQDFLDRLRASINHRDEGFRADIGQWLNELSRPERSNLLRDTFNMCVSATETCEDRVTWALGKLQELRLQDDIRMGRYADRPAQALDGIWQILRLRKLARIAQRNVAAGLHVDEVEVYLGYSVALRDELGLTTVAPAMRFFDVSGIRSEDLADARNELRQAEHADFYAELVLDDTWHLVLQQKLSARYERAQERLLSLSGAPLMEKIRAALNGRDLDAADSDVQRSLGATIWRKMRYSVLEPLTREFLAQHGLELPGSACLPVDADP